MARFIVRVPHGKGATLLEWSTVVDAPVAAFANEAELEQSVKEEEGTRGLEALRSRLERLREKGTTSKVDASAEESVRLNRAGSRETCMTWRQIQDWCEAGCFNPMPVGRCRCNAKDENGNRPSCGEP